MTTNVNVNAAGGSGYAPRDMTGRSTVAGLFRDRVEAESAINALKDAGFRADEVGVAMRDRTAQGQLVEDTGTKAAEGATSGAVGGGLLGGVVGFLVGLGALAIPGIGPVVAGGALASAFGLAGGTAVAGAGIGAAAGGLIGALVGMGIPEDEARHFDTGFREGGVLVTVRAGARAMDALAILERYGADTGPGSMGASSGHERHTGSGETAVGAVAGGLAGAAAGAAIGTMIAPGPGTAAGAAIGGAAAAASGTAAGAAIGAGAGALGGAAAGKGIHEARPADHDDKAAEGSTGGGLAGAAAGAAIGTVVAGPGPGTIAGAAIGGAAGAASGGAAGAADDDDDRTRTTTTRR